MKSEQSIFIRIFVFVVGNQTHKCFCVLFMNNAGYNVKYSIIAYLYSIILIIMQHSIQYQSLVLNTRIYLGDYLHAMQMLSNREIVLITDEHLKAYYPALISKFKHIVIPPGEDSKSMDMLNHVLNQLFDMKASRDTVIVGFGGGVVTDLAAFVAGIFKRGIDFILMPTSLLGMADAAIGGKCGINYYGAKNQLGLIKQPLFTFIDTKFLRTLPYLHFINGLAELVKSSLIFPGNSWELIENQREAIMKIESDQLQILLQEAVQNKIRLVELDVSDVGKRQLLNFGHSFGHAVEANEKILHGLAVSKGMIAALKMSVAAGYLKQKRAIAIVKQFEALGLPVNFTFKAEYFIYLEQDKKRSGDSMNFVFLRNPGDAFIEKITISQLKALAYDARNISF
ncbi:MAG: 3-dehydroquinate synthase family protein [Bacteroidota bacterium]|nr:3-dehydroquinate synthase family protein [Bacteroidota bacterium]